MAAREVPAWDGHLSSSESGKQGGQRNHIRITCGHRRPKEHVSPSPGGSPTQAPTHATTAVLAVLHNTAGIARRCHVHCVPTSLRSTVNCFCWGSDLRHLDHSGSQPGHIVTTRVLGRAHQRHQGGRWPMGTPLLSLTSSRQWLENGYVERAQVDSLRGSVLRTATHRSTGVSRALPESRTTSGRWAQAMGPRMQRVPELNSKHNKNQLPPAAPPLCSTWCCA